MFFASKPADDAVVEESDSPSLTHSLSEWIMGASAQAWLASMMLHLIVLLCMALVLGTIQVVRTVTSAPSFSAVNEDTQPEPTLMAFESSPIPEEPTILDLETIVDTKPITIEAQHNDSSPNFQYGGGGTAGDNERALSTGNGIPSFKPFGPRVPGPTGLGGGGGSGDTMGKGGHGKGFGPRGTGDRIGISGATKPTERAVALALNWIARHQNKNGSWSLDHRASCDKGGCSGQGEINSDAAATALALLPFLAAGQTHQGKGVYRRNVEGGLIWLISNQKQNGDLSAGSSSQMYTHGLATIALCEAYGMSQDSRIGLAAQAAIRFIQTGQNREGSWRYSHGSDDSDTSVHGWQVMALKSGQMAGLEVSEQTIAGSKSYLKLVATGGRYREQFGYMPGGGPTLPMTSVGLLATQYLGANRDDPVITGGVEYLSKNQPSLDRRNIYYWYYATQVMHNVQGPEWDVWNRNMRSLLINSQAKNGCEAGSWDPIKPTPDAWGRQGGRLMCTSLSCLTLEVYYRYLPLYKIEKKDLE
ncbi:hypothetical protein [Anatilimnocola floriformis]|uniref:hypothetical protein n=1 Tax=Anatilimnocola floriformis TaxID=2948575 RepID=UPI0020C1E11E|nr:hypothetical protein [Anatilimnocola floriformis]